MSWRSTKVKSSPLSSCTRGREMGILNFSWVLTHLNFFWTSLTLYSSAHYEEQDVSQKRHFDTFGDVATYWFFFQLTVKLVENPGATTVTRRLWVKGVAVAKKMERWVAVVWGWRLSRLRIQTSSEGSTQSSAGVGQGLATNSIFSVCFLYVKKSLICKLQIK